MAVTREGLDNMMRIDDMRLAHLRSSSERNHKTERQLRSWVNAMNLRVRVHYLYLPLFLFGIALLWSIFGLSRDFLNQLV
jgi:hypothetical protein